MKKEICLVTALLLLVGTQAAYAGTSGSPDAAIDLSIKDAVEIMQTTGTRAETAELNKKSDQAVAAGYREAVSTINDTLKKINDLSKLNATAGMAASIEAQEAGATEVNKKVSKLRRDFAKEQIEPNYRAEMNQIEYNTLKAYYGVLLAQDNLKTEHGNLKAQQDILKNTKAQYEVGMLAKKDVLSAQSAVTSAQSSVQAAETKLEYAKMGFNFLLGYSATQEVVFTDTMNVVTSPAIETEAAVKNAIANRNEIKGADFAVQVYQVLLDDVKAYPKSSSTYLKRQISLLTAQKQAKDAPVQIEIDIRSKAAGLEDKMMALQAAKAMKAYAEEGYRLISITYDAGMMTLAELQQAQTNVYKAGLAVSAATNDYDLACYEFRYAQDVGTERLPL